jgi:carbonic anhydrase
MTQTDAAFIHAEAERALARLLEGNRRFLEGRPVRGHASATWREQLVAVQQPFATILGCADSRIPPELIFDQGFGDLFVIRVAGNVLGDEVAGSLQYAVHHLKTPLIVVLGHEGCGAVTAAVQAMLGKHDEPHYIEALIGMIEPGLRGLDLGMPDPARLEIAVENNVRHAVRRLAESPGGQQFLGERNGRLVGAVYELATGRVRLLDGAGPA